MWITTSAAIQLLCGIVVLAVFFFDSRRGVMTPLKLIFRTSPSGSTTWTVSMGGVGSGLSDLAFRFAFWTRLKQSPLVCMSLRPLTSLSHGIFSFKFANWQCLRSSTNNSRIDWPSFVHSRRNPTLRRCSWVSAIGEPFTNRVSWPKRFLMNLNVSLPTDARRIALFCFQSVITLALK